MPTAARKPEERLDLAEDNVSGFAPETEPISLTARDWEVFLSAWDDVDRPRPRLEELVERYRNTRLSDVG